MLLHKKLKLDWLIYTENDIHPKENHILVMIGKNIKKSSNPQLEHLQLIKGIIVDVATVIKTTRVMNMNLVVQKSHLLHQLK